MSGHASEEKGVVELPLESDSRWIAADDGVWAQSQILLSLRSERVPPVEGGASLEDVASPDSHEESGSPEQLDSPWMAAAGGGSVMLPWPSLPRASHDATALIGGAVGSGVADGEEGRGAGRGGVRRGTLLASGSLQDLLRDVSALALGGLGPNGDSGGRGQREGGQGRLGGEEPGGQEGCVDTLSRAETGGGARLATRGGAMDSTGGIAQTQESEGAAGTTSDAPHLLAPSHPHRAPPANTPESEGAAGRMPSDARDADGTSTRGVGWLMAGTRGGAIDSTGGIAQTLQSEGAGTTKTGGTTSDARDADGTEPPGASRGAGWSMAAWSAGENSNSLTDLLGRSGVVYPGDPDWERVSLSYSDDALVEDAAPHLLELHKSDKWIAGGEVRAGDLGGAASAAPEAEHFPATSEVLHGTSSEVHGMMATSATMATAEVSHAHSPGAAGALPAAAHAGRGGGEAAHVEGGGGVGVGAWLEGAATVDRRRSSGVPHSEMASQDVEAGMRARLEAEIRPQVEAAWEGEVRAREEAVRRAVEKARDAEAARATLAALLRTREVLEQRARESAEARATLESQRHGQALLAAVTRQQKEKVALAAAFEEKRAVFVEEMKQLEWQLGGAQETAGGQDGTIKEQEELLREAHEELEHLSARADAAEAEVDEVRKERVEYRARGAARDRELQLAREEGVVGEEQVRLERGEKNELRSRVAALQREVGEARVGLADAVVAGEEAVARGGEGEAAWERESVMLRKKVDAAEKAVEGYRKEELAGLERGAAANTEVRMLREK
ncbi:hypothetical protein T484DRAFT_1795138, partial [Baffinella frigidus]